MSDQSITLNRAAGRRFSRIAEDFFTSEVRWRARVLFPLLIAFALIVNDLNIANSYVRRDFTTAISHSDQTGVVRQAILYVGVFAVSTAVAVLYRFTHERLGLFWRVWLTRRIAQRYLPHRAYLRLKESAKVDHLDQQIADDVRAFMATTLSFTLMSMS
jgi:putative ATP-binding cassette transporter